MSSTLTPIQTPSVLLPNLALYSNAVVTIDRPHARDVLDVYERANRVLTEAWQLVDTLDLARGPSAPSRKTFDYLRSSLHNVGRAGFLGSWIGMIGGVMAYPNSSPGYYFVVGGIAGLYASMGCLFASLRCLPFEKQILAKRLDAATADTVEKLQKQFDALEPDERRVLGGCLVATIERKPGLLPDAEKAKLLTALVEAKPNATVDAVYSRAQQVANFALALRTNRSQHNDVSDLKNAFSSASNEERDAIAAILSDPLSKSSSPYRDDLLKMLATPRTAQLLSPA